ncbi:hypothetical protein BDZ97DRAFT_1796435 [Flammula alnicola]|nr:hypothetical protein BDZ97DRAFT_1796435 [Flammula alnicola]
MVITILNSFFHLLQRKEITNGQSLFDDHIELLEQCILSPRRGLPDIDLDLYSRMLNQIRSRHLVYDCSESARSGNHPCSSCRDDVRGAPEAVYKLKVLITVAWYSSAEYSMDSKTPSGLRRAHMVKQCMRSLQTLGDIHANHDSVAIHLEFARLSLTQSSYSTSLADYLDSFAESKSGNSQALLTALSKDHPSEVSTLAFAVQAYIQRFESAIQPDLLKRLKKRWSHVSVDAASAAHDDVANGVNSNAPLAQNLPGSFNTRRPFNQSGRTSHRRGGIWNINVESGRTRK